MATHRSDINAEMQQIAAEAQSATLEAFAFATLADRYGRLPDDVELPSAGMVIQIDGPHVELAHGTFGARGVAYAVVTMVAACEQYLHRLWRAAQVGTKILSRPERSLPASRFFRLRDQAKGLSTSTNVNGLVRELLVIVGATEADLPSAAWLRDIYAVRNCLVHRGGIVDEVSAPSGVLQMKWRRLVIMVEGSTIEALGHQVEKGDVVSKGYRDVEHQWRVGEKVELGVQDCADVAHSFIGFVYEIATLPTPRSAQ